MAASIRTICSRGVFNNIRQLTGIQQSTSHLKCIRVATIRTSSARPNLMEFFDDEKNWGLMEVKAGRGWKLEELRIKSNQDLHKLWYVLLKERNMLMTMEHACNEEARVFPNPERLDKVKDSMDNIEQVVRERNEAFWALEVGEKPPAPRPSNDVDSTDRNAVLKTAVDLVTQVDDATSAKFRMRLREAERKYTRQALNCRKNHVMGLLKRFPDMDMEALREQYPEVDIEKLKLQKKTRGHHDANTA